MSETLQAARLRTCFSVHLPPVTLPLPKVPVDQERFPSAKEGFEDFSMVTHHGDFGLAMSLIDISGIEYDQVERRLLHDMGAQLITKPFRLLQTLEYLEGPYGISAHPDLSFSQIVAYHATDHVFPTVVERLSGGGWRRIPQPVVLGGWAPGTLGLFFVDSL